jgi:hypothetical protein
MNGGNDNHKDGEEKTVRRRSYCAFFHKIKLHLLSFG